MHGVKTTRPKQKKERKRREEEDHEENNRRTTAGGKEGENHFRTSASKYQGKQGQNWSRIKIPKGGLKKPPRQGGGKKMKKAGGVPKKPPSGREKWHQKVEKAIGFRTG